jgi:hypothetical protein
VNTYPRDRWVGASPELNVTPGGKALEALERIREYLIIEDLTLDAFAKIIKEVKVYD